VTLMAAIFLAPMFAALYMFMAAGSILLAIHLTGVARSGWSLREAIAPARRFLDSYIEMISDISLLLATLAILTGAFVITGVPTKLGTLLVEAGGVSMIAMWLMAFIFGVILGCGLPPAPVYILVAIVIAPPFIKAGINPWVVHFYAFFLGVFGELTPPTSITAAVTSKIAGASFYTTLFRSLKICVSLFSMMAAIFIHPELVVQPGWGQIGAALLVFVATIGITFSLQASYFDRRLPDLAVRLVLAALALTVLLTPNYTIASAFAVPVLLIVGYWVLYRRTRLDDGKVTEVDLERASLAAVAAVGGVDEFEPG